jgi:hypothetical protein
MDLHPYHTEYHDTTCHNNMPLPNAFDIYPLFINFQPRRVIKWVTKKLYQLGGYVFTKLYTWKYIRVKDLPTQY